MFEKIFACLLCLYPSGFREKYREEAFQLYRDRLRDETGLFRRTRLYCDLFADAAIGLPKAWRNSYAGATEPSAAPSAEVMPYFRTLAREPIRREAIFFGSMLSIASLFALSVVASLPTAVWKSTASGRSTSSVESVMQRVNHAAVLSGSDLPADGNSSTASGALRAQVSASGDAKPGKDSKAAGDSMLAGGHDVAEPRLEDATDAMIRLFDRHDIVMFGEIHGNKQEYEWLCRLVKTPAFANHLDDIVVEFGNALYQKDVDRYVAGEDVSREQIEKAWRNMIASVGPVSPVYEEFYKAVREANLQNSGRHRIRLIMGSPPGDWDKIRTAQDLAPYEAQREQWYLHAVKEEVLNRHHRALLIMGARHFLRGSEQALQDELLEQEDKPVPPIDRSQLAPGYIERELRAAGADPYLVVMGTDAVNSRGDVDRRIDSWPMPALVAVRDNWVGNLPAQPVTTGGHAAATPLTLADQTDAIVYVAPCSVLRSVHPSHAELDGTSYERELARRSVIELGHAVEFEYGETPDCVQNRQSAKVR